MDDAIEAWVESLTDESLVAPFTFTSMQGFTATFPFWVVVAHVFNHQTHHRGQITTLMNQAGYDSGVTDLLQMPGVGNWPAP
jgi:uncharacterized damage-inducible protein DinB